MYGVQKCVGEGGRGKGEGEGGRGSMQLQPATHKNNEPRCVGTYYRKEFAHPSLGYIYPE